MHEAQKHAGLPWIEYKKVSWTGRPIPFPSNPIASRTVCRLGMRQLQIQDYHLLSLLDRVVLIRKGLSKINWFCQWRSR